MFKDLRFLGLVLLALFPISTYAMVSIATVIFLGLVLITFLKEKNRKLRKPDILNIFKYCFFYLLLIFSLFYSNNLNTGVKTIIRTIPLLLFPLFLFLFSRDYSLNERKKNIILLIFISSSFLLLLYVFYLTFNSIGNFHMHSVRDKMLDNSFLDLHSTYVSLYFSAAMSILVFFNPLKCHLGKRIFLIFLFAIGLIVIFSRAVIFITLFEAFLFLFLLDKLQFYKKAMLFISSVIIIVTLFYKVPFLHGRVAEIFKYGLDSTKDDRKLSSTAMRMAVYNCFFELATEQPIIGYGIGDLQMKLNNCYEKLNSPTFSKKKLNTHNFYFFLMGSAGILSLIFFLILVFDLLMKLCKNKDWTLFYIFLLLFLTLFTENVLTRSYGISFYCFFFTIFSFTHNSKQLK